MAQHASNFNPTDADLLESLLHRVTGVRHQSHNHIRVADLYGKKEPWEIFRDADESKRLYFFTELTAYGVMKFSRTVGSGRWVTRAQTIAVEMGYKKRFRYEPPKEGSGDQNSRWHMDEYSLREDCPEYDDYAICVLWKIAAEKVGSRRDQGQELESGLDPDVDRRGNLIQG